MLTPYSVIFLATYPSLVVTPKYTYAPLLEHLYSHAKFKPSTLSSSRIWYPRSLLAYNTYVLQTIGTHKRRRPRQYWHNPNYVTPSRPLLPHPCRSKLGT